MDAKIQHCEQCGESYIAKTPRSRFCGTACRMRAHRGSPGVVVASLGESSTGPGQWGRVFSATMAELSAAGREGTAIGTAALMIAQQLDGDVPAAARATLTKELRTSLVEALRGAAKSSGPQQLRDELAARRAAQA